MCNGRMCKGELFFYSRQRGTRKCLIAKAISWPIWDVPLLIWKPRGGPRADSDISVVILCLFTLAELVREFKTRFAFPLRMTSVTFLILFPFFSCFSTSLDQFRKGSPTTLTVQPERSSGSPLHTRLVVAMAFFCGNMVFVGKNVQTCLDEAEDFNHWGVSFIDRRSSHSSSISTSAITWSWEWWLAG